MNNRSPRDIALAFVDRINAHDVDGLCALMSDNHLFIDSLNTKVRGRSTMRKAWRAYFLMVPDFTVELSEAMVAGPIVGLFGTARGTFSRDGTLAVQDRWEMPAAWRAVIRENLVAEWQIYADNEPVRALMSNPGR